MSIHLHGEAGSPPEPPPAVSSAVAAAPAVLLSPFLHWSSRSCSLVSLLRAPSVESERKPAAALYLEQPEKQTQKINDYTAHQMIPTSTSLFTFYGGVKYCATDQLWWLKLTLLHHRGHVVYCTCIRFNSEHALLCSWSLASIAADSFWMRAVSTEKKNKL